MSKSRIRKNINGLKTTEKTQKTLFLSVMLINSFHLHTKGEKLKTSIFNVSPN